VFRILSIASILATAALTPPASAWNSFGRSCSIQGQVQADSLPAGGNLSVEVSGMSGADSASALVSGTGDFTIEAAPKGAAILRVRDGGGAILHQEIVASSSCDGMLIVRIPEKKRERPAGGVVSVSELARKIAPEAAKQYGKGEDALNKKNYAKAGEHFQKAIEIDPSFVKAYTSLGVVYAARGDRENAILEYRKALAIQNDYIPARVNLSAEMWNQQRYAEAEESARIVLKSDPTIDKARVILGFSLASQGNLEEGLTNLRAVAGKEPQAHLGIAGILARQGHKQEAVEHLKTFLEKGEPKNRETVEAWIGALAAAVAQARR
jgi:Tfp pilus assembly protein PilF